MILKKGDTASSQDTKDKANSLSKKLKQLGKNYIGGIAILENGIWYYNNSEQYEYTERKLNKDWKKFRKLI